MATHSATQTFSVNGQIQGREKNKEGSAFRAVVGIDSTPNLQLVKGTSTTN